MPTMKRVITQPLALTDRGQHHLIMDCMILPHAHQEQGALIVVKIASQRTMQDQRLFDSETCPRRRDCTDLLRQNLAEDKSTCSWNVWQ